MDNVDKDVQKKQINPSPSLHALFFAPAPDPAAEAGLLAAGVGPAARRPAWPPGTASPGDSPPGRRTGACRGWAGSPAGN